MASTYAPPTRRYALRGHAWQRSSHPVLLLVTAGVFVVSALALLIPQTPIFSRALSAPSVTAATPPITASDVETVLSYARAMQPDDALVQVRPGVFAKRSNVHGVEIGGRTLFYDIAAHQSFGPLRSGKLAESDVNVIAREAQNGFLILVYTRK